MAGSDIQHRRSWRPFAAPEGYNAQLSIAYILAHQPPRSTTSPSGQFPGRPNRPNVTERGSHQITPQSIACPLYVVKITKMWRSSGACSWLAHAEPGRSAQGRRTDGLSMDRVVIWPVSMPINDESGEGRGAVRELNPAQEGADACPAPARSPASSAKVVILSRSRMKCLFRAWPPSLLLAMAMKPSPRIKAEALSVDAAYRPSAS